VSYDYNEIELLILVTPELCDAMSPCQVPPCGPGMQTAMPNDCDLYLKGHLEVPRCCATCSGAGCAACVGAGGGMRAEEVLGPTPVPPGGPEVIQTPGPRPRSPAPSPSDAPGALLRSGGSGVAGRGAVQGAALPAVASRPTNPQNPLPSSRPQVPSPLSGPAATAGEPGLIGPAGYDVK